MSSWKNLYKQEYTSKIKTLYPAEEITNFINKFFCRTPFSDPITSRKMYLNGNCYWFAIILKERFKNYLPTIWYDTLNNHFYTEIAGILYDAAGAFLPKNNLTDQEYDSFYIWKDYKKFDPIHAKRIERDCINFTYEEN